MTTPEVWQDIPGYEGRYLASNLGHIAVKRGGELVGRKLQNRRRGGQGYLSFSTYDRRTILVHKAVALAFLGPRPPGHIIRHLDNDSHNNAVTNLRYGLPRENGVDQRWFGSQQGERNGRAKLDQRCVQAIRCLLDEGVSLSALARAFAVTPTLIMKIKQRKLWA
jgi:hypothetical protein